MMKLLKNNGSKTLTKIEFANDFDRYSDDKSNYHEAGYDSYITAWVFLQMHEVGQTYLNKLNLNFSFFKIDFNRDLDQIDDHVIVGLFSMLGIF